MTKEGNTTVRIFKKGAEPTDPILALTPAERMLMVWPITCDAWSMTGKFDAESRLQRDVVRLIRRKR